MFAIINDAIKSNSKKYIFPISTIDGIGVRVNVNKKYLEIESNSINSLICGGDIDNTPLGMFPIRKMSIVWYKYFK